MGTRSDTRKLAGLLGSLVAHGLLLAWVMGQDPSAPPPPAQAEPVEVHIVELTLPHVPALSEQAAVSGQPDAVTRTAAPEPLPELDEPPPPPPKPQPKPQPDPPQSPTSEPDPAPQPNDTTAPALPLEPPPESPEAPPAEPPPSLEPAPNSNAPDTNAAGRPTASPGRGSSRATGSLLGDGDLDHSAYGAEIVRLVMAEIDEDPVFGIPSGHAIQIGLKVLPSGRLARSGLGRFDFAKVFASTVGRVRTRAILRRVERASRRFPRHPAGFPRRNYEIAFTVRFTGN
ncbi:MAG: hypothetical protein AB1Z98_02330 [Nannocystaceae bacterium]